MNVSNNSIKMSPKEIVHFYAPETKIKYNKINKKTINDNTSNINNNNNFSFFNKDNSDFNNRYIDEQTGISLISDKSPDLDWENYESIYKNLISHIKLMIINIGKDNNKLCKYLKEIFYAVFNISQKTCYFYKTIFKFNSKQKNVFERNKSTNDISKPTNNSCQNIDWVFYTGGKDNNKLIDKFGEKNKKGNTSEKLLRKYKIITPRIRESKAEKNLDISLLEEKYKKLTKKMKKKEKQFNVDKLHYLFQINEQNKIIKDLEDQLKVKNFNSLSSRSQNEIKCFSDYSKMYESLRKRSEAEENNRSVRNDRLFYLNNKINKKFFISHPKLNYSDISIDGKKCYNPKDILEKNLFKLRNRGRPYNLNLKKFTSISINDTRMQVNNILNKKEL